MGRFHTGDKMQRRPAAAAGPTATYGTVVAAANPVAAATNIPMRASSHSACTRNAGRIA